MNINTNNNQGIADFDWDLFESGYNTKFKTEQGVKIYSHEDYAEDEYNRVMGRKGIELPKDAAKTGTIYKITDLKPLSNHEVLATINYGASDIVIDLNKETKYLSLFQDEDGNPLSPELFTQYLKMESYKNHFLSNQMSVQVIGDHKKQSDKKVSIWDGYIQSLVEEMYNEIKSPSKAYTAKIISNNSGGYFVEVMDSVKAFMPGSMAAMNKLTDFESLLGKSMYVMVESYNSKFGFIVSHKKYLKAILPSKLEELKKEWEKNPEKLYSGIITGTTKYGIFIELEGLFTGMLHKTLISDDLKLRWKTGEIEPQEKIEVYIHNIDNGRIIFSDVPLENRAAVQELREAEDALEKEAIKTPEQKEAEKKKAEEKQRQQEEKKIKKAQEFNNKIQDLMNKFNQ